jgi:hypothetical protein
MGIPQLWQGFVLEVVMNPVSSLVNSVCRVPT